MDIKLIIRNYLGIKDQSFNLDGTTLITGRNGGGKSSICNALSTLLCSNLNPRNLSHKKYYLNDEKEDFYISLNIGDDNRTYASNQKNLQVNTDGAKYYNQLLIDTAYITDIKKSQRVSEFNKLFSTKPSKEQFVDFYYTYVLLDKKTMDEIVDLVENKT